MRRRPGPHRNNKRSEHQSTKSRRMGLDAVPRSGREGSDRQRGVRRDRQALDKAVEGVAVMLLNEDRPPAWVDRGLLAPLSGRSRSQAAYRKPGLVDEQPGLLPDAGQEPEPGGPGLSG